MGNPTWLLLGATGVTGRLIAAEAVRRGQRPILAGRSAERLRPIAEASGLSWRVVDLAEPVCYSGRYWANITIYDKSQLGDAR